MMLKGIDQLKMVRTSTPLLTQLGTSTPPAFESATNESYRGGIVLDFLVIVGEIDGLEWMYTEA